MRGLLARFEREGLAVAGGVVADAADDFANADVVGMRVVFRDESDVAGDAGDAEARGEIADA
jgi:hypothetical protein